MKVLLILLLVHFGSIYGDVIEPYGTEICRLFADGAKLRQPGNCESYITCKDGISTVTKCSKYFSKASSACSLTAPTDTYCKDPCSKTSPTWVADPKSCSGYYKCVSGKGTAGECLYGLHFGEAQQSCIYTQDSSCIGYEYCSIVPNGVPFKNEASCNSYYVCVKDKLTEEFCESGYYHPQLGCVRSSTVECQDHPVPFYVCGTAKRPIYEKFVNDERTCRGYYYCKDMGEHVADVQPNWGQCPLGRFFSFVEQGCVIPTAVKCEDDRCDGRNRSMVVSGTKGCQHYLICDGDKTVSEKKCDNDWYFDDDAQQCSATIQKYLACS